MYKYEDLKQEVFKEENQESFLKVRDNAQKLLKTAGAVKLINLINCVSGDSWTQMAYVDRLLELGEIREIPTNGTAQDRIFIKGK